MKEKEAQKVIENTDFKFKIVPTEKNLEFPEIPDVPVISKKADEEVPDLIHKKHMIEPSVEDEIPVNPSSPKASDYILSQIKKIDLLFEENILNGVRTIFDRLKKYTHSAKLSDKQKKLFQYELERLNTEITLKEI
jgi:hypothetical protein